MVDTADLALSEFYFTVIQILRISAEWIQESMDDLQRMVDDMEQLYFASPADAQAANFLPGTPTADGDVGATASNVAMQEAAANMFRKNWNGVILEQQRLGNALLARVAKIEQETKSLRDGVRGHENLALTGKAALTPPGSRCSTRQRSARRRNPRS